MGRIRAALKRLERAADWDTLSLECPECSKTWRVRGDADLEYLAHIWAKEYGGETYRETPQDVLQLVEHEHSVDALIDKNTNKPWLEDLVKAPGPILETWDEH